MLGCLVPSLYSAYTDATKRYLYDYITIPIFLAGFIYSIYIGSWINIITAVVVFAIFMVFALKGGIAGGDVKFTTALAIWFGYPSIIYLIAIASILAFIFGSLMLLKKGLFTKRMMPFFKGLYYRFIYGVNVIPENKLPENGEISDEAVPFGTFLVIAAWLVYLKGVVYMI